MRRLAAALGSVMLVVGSVRGQEAPERYEALLEAAKKDPAKADFRRLRLAFTRTESYRPYTKRRFDLAPVYQELKNGERAVALLALDRMLEGHWMDPEAQGIASGVCEEIGEGERAALHAAFMKGIVDTILGAGDGRSFEKAWPVLDVGEEYLILRAYDLRDGKQSLVEHDGHWYDVHEFRDEESGRDVTVYFNVDLPHRWLEERLRRKGDGPPSKEAEN